MAIDVEIDIDGAIRGLTELEQRHVPFAAARALTQTAQQGQRRVRQHLPQVFTLRNDWTRRGIRVRPANKRTLQAAVFSRDWYLGDHETGGTRTPRDARALSVPVGARGSTSQTIPRSRRPARLLSRPRHFIARMASGKAGIFQRVGRARLPIRLMYSFEDDVTFDDTLNMTGVVGETATNDFPVRFHEAVDQALATAR